MPLPSSEVLDYYAQPGPLTTLPDSPDINGFLANLPHTVEDIVRAVQGNVLHIFWAERYGVTLTERHHAQLQMRTATKMLMTIYQTGNAPFTTPRTNDQKLCGNCRDFTVLTVALLRLQGYPARARCGFGTYFRKDRYEDHWVAEYWHEGQERWIMVDAQLDPFQLKQLGDLVQFDPLDVPRGGPGVSGFVTGPHAWELIRKHGADPQHFGIFNMHGLGFVAGDFLRDVAALNKIELLPWDCWGLMKPDPQYTDQDCAYLDRIAALVEADDTNAIRAHFAADEHLRVPPLIQSYINGQMVPVTLADQPGYAA